MKKFNWGWGVTLFYSIFVVFMLAMVWYASSQKIEMVTPDYYGKELVFQGQIDKQKRTSELKEQLQWQIENKSVLLKFPENTSDKSVKAKILFYRPGDSSKDFTVDVTPGADGTTLVQSEKFEKGRYRMQIDWSVDDVGYYNEGVININ